MSYCLADKLDGRGTKAISDPRVGLSKRSYSSLQLAAPLRNSRAMGVYSVTCHPAEVTFSPLPQRSNVVDMSSDAIALFMQAPAQDPRVQALDSAGCSCECRVPSSGAVVTVQRVRRRLQMSRLNSTQPLRYAVDRECIQQ